MAHLAFFHSGELRVVPKPFADEIGKKTLVFETKQASLVSDDIGSHLKAFYPRYQYCRRVFRKCQLTHPDVEGHFGVASSTGSGV